MSGSRSIGRRRNEISPRNATARYSIATATGRPIERDGSDILRPDLLPDLRLQRDQRAHEVETRLDRVPLGLRRAVDRLLELDELDRRPGAVTLLRELQPLLTQSERSLRELDRRVRVLEIDERLADFRLDRELLLPQLRLRVGDRRVRARDRRRGLEPREEWERSRKTERQRTVRRVQVEERVVLARADGPAEAERPGKPRQPGAPRRAAPRLARPERGLALADPGARRQGLGDQRARVQERRVEDVRHLIGEIEARFARDAHLLQEPQLRLPRLAPRPKQLLLLAQDLGLRAEQLLASGRADLEPALRDLE